MNRILVITTGGTIGCKAQDATIDLAGRPIEIIERCRGQIGAEIEFDVICPFEILSENLQISDWQRLFDAIDSVRFEQYDGIIITHGSDTLCYTAAAVALAFADAPIPILLTASNYPLADLRANGIANFCAAVTFIEQKLCRGVFTVYRNDAGHINVYLATRMRSADRYTDAFGCMGDLPFAEVIGDRVVLRKSALNPSLEQLNCDRMRIRRNPLENKILLIHPYPSIDYDCIRPSAAIKAVLHTTYHSATLPESCAAFVRQCKASGIETYLCSFKSTDIDLYASSRVLLDAGAIPLYNISEEAAYAKLVLAYNQSTMPPQEFMQKTLFFEQLPMYTQS